MFLNEAPADIQIDSELMLMIEDHLHDPNLRKQINKN